MPTVELPEDEAGSGGLVGLFGLVDRDLVAERFELALESPGAVLGRVAPALPVGSEFAERDLVADDVVVGDEDVVAGRADRLGLAATPAQLRVVGGEVGALGPSGGFRGLGQRLAQPLRPGAGSA
jgi:hypothetical protein